MPLPAAMRTRRQPVPVKTVFLAATTAVRRCRPIGRLTRSICRCRTTCTPDRRCVRWKPARMCFAKSRSRRMRRKPRRWSIPPAGLAGCWPKPVLGWRSLRPPACVRCWPKAPSAPCDRSPSASRPLSAILTTFACAPKTGGGARLDLGRDCVSLLRIVAGAGATSVTASADWAEAGVDRIMVATSAFADGLTATLNCSFLASCQRQAVIHGSEGSLVATFRNHAPGPDAEPMLLWRGGALTTRPAEIASPGGRGFLAEAEAVRLGPQHRAGAFETESLDIARMMEASAAIARSGTAITLSATG